MWDLVWFVLLQRLLISNFYNFLLYIIKDIKDRIGALNSEKKQTL